MGLLIRIRPELAAKYPAGRRLVVLEQPEPVRLPEWRRRMVRDGLPPKDLTPRPAA